MDYEKMLGRAYDLLADNQDEQAEALLEDLVRDLKKSLDGTFADAQRYFYWGQCLSALDEPEQALLRYEKALDLRPDHEEALWQTVSTFLYDLENAEAGEKLLTERLLPLAPGNPKYLEALAVCRLQKRMSESPPVEAGPERQLPGKDEGPLNSP